MSNGLDSDQDRHYVGPDLVQNCLQRLSETTKVAAIYKERVKSNMKNTMRYYVSARLTKLLIMF